MPVPPAPDPYEEVAMAVQAIINDEFSAESFTAIHDRLHESVGSDRVMIGISPESDRPMPRNRNVAEFRLLVQFYGLWKKEVDNYQHVNPFTITGYAARFKRAMKAATTPLAGTPEVWYFDVEDITYPNDPTGNKTRFHAIIRAHGNNSALVETSA